MRWIFVVLAGLAGCAQLPADLRDQGIRLERSSPNGPAAAAQCLARNAGGISGAVSELQWNADLSRVLSINARPHPSLPVETIAAARIRSSGTGSAVEIWLKPGAYAAPDQFADRLVRGC